MGMPVIKNNEVENCDAAASLLQSIALEEAALAHILNAEGEKIQKAVCMPNTDIKDLINVNKSVSEVIEKVNILEKLLKENLEIISPILKKCEKKHIPREECEE